MSRTRKGAIAESRRPVVPIVLNVTGTPGIAALASSVPCTLTSVPQDDVIIVAVTGSTTSAQGSYAVSSVAATGLTFIARASKHGPGRFSGFRGTDTFYAVVPSGGFTGVITATFDRTIDSANIHAFSVTEADTTSPFGAGSSVLANATSAAPINTTFSAPAGTFVFVAAGTESGVSGPFYSTTAAGFTNINTAANPGSFNAEWSAVDYQIPGSALSGATVGWGTNSYAFFTLIADALVPA